MNMRKKKLSGAAFAAALVLGAGSLTACGGDDAEASDATGAAGATDAAAAASGAGLDGSEALQAMQVKAEENGYDSCMMTPASSSDLSTIRLACVQAGLPQISLFDKADRESGSEVVEAELDEIEEFSADQEYAATREDMGGKYRALDGDDVVGSCNDLSNDDCDDIAEALGLESTLPDGAITEEEFKANLAEEMERDAKEAEEKRKKEEEEKERELQTYSGWDDLSQAREQLSAWDLACSEASGSGGQAAWCALDSVLVTFDMDIDELEDQGVFQEVSRDDMVSVSDDDWIVMCSPGSHDRCEMIADKTGKSVKDGV